MECGCFLLFIVVACVVWVILLVTRAALARKKYSQLLPTKRKRFYDLLGNLGDIPFSSKRRNGLPFNVFWIQVASGYAKLFEKESLFTFWISFEPFVILKKASTVEALLNGNKLMEKGWNYKLLQPWLGTGLLTSHGNKWKMRRKLLTPSFHFEILKDFLAVFNEQSQLLVKLLKIETSKDFTNIVKPITLCSLDIICETTLGASLKAQENGESEYVKSVDRATDLLMQRMMNCFYWSDFIYSFTTPGRELKKHLTLLHDFTRSVIREKKTKLLIRNTEVKSSRRKALLDLLLEHHIETKELSEEDIREEVDTFTFEGHDTTSMGMSWALYLIGLHLKVQAQIHSELDQIFGEDKERHATTEDLNAMKCLDRVLKESQRIYPSVPFIARHANEATELCGFPIPKGATCTVATYLLHRDAAVFPNPERFDPDRFLPENCVGRSPFAYVPFSAGPRNCIGQRFAIMEEKTVVSTILRSYKLESLDGRDQLPPSPNLVLRSPVPVRIRIRPRN